MIALLEKIDRLGFTVEICSYYGPCIGARLTSGKSLKTLESLSRKIRCKKFKEFVYIGDESPSTEYGKSYQEYCPKTGE